MMRARDRLRLSLGRGAARSRADAIVFTNGVFDLLHPGHVRYLAEAGGSAMR